MSWEFFDDFAKLFSEFGDFVAFLSESFKQFPSLFTFVLSFTLVVIIIVGALYMCFKLIG